MAARFYGVCFRSQRGGAAHALGRLDDDCDMWAVLRSACGRCDLAVDDANLFPMADVVLDERCGMPACFAAFQLDDDRRLRER